MKKFQKVLLFALMFVLVFTTFAFATEGSSQVQPRTTTSENPEEGVMPISGESATNENPQILYKDVFRFDENIEFAELVDGNVFLFGNTVKVSNNSEINGSLYVFANEVVIEENSFIYHSLYVFANKLTLNGVCYDLYSACNEFNMGVNSYVYRDLNLCCASAELTGYVNRNANIATNSLVLGHPNGATILGDLNYTAPQEFMIDENAVAGTTTFKLETPKEENTLKDTISEHIFEAIFIFVVFLLAALLAPKFVSRSGEYAFSLKLVHALWIGLVATVALVFLDIALLFLLPKLALVFILLTIVAIILTAPVFAIAFTSAIANKAKMTNFGLKVLINLGVSIAMVILTLIPGLGMIFGTAYYILGLGFMVLYLLDGERRKTKKIEEEK